jgi:hypothetical protein
MNYAAPSIFMLQTTPRPASPAALKSALQAVVVNTMSNNSGYSWAEDEEGLRFLIPRFLSHMKDDYAWGIAHATEEVIADTLPEALKRELREGGA